MNEIIETILTRTKITIESKLKLEYQKRFGEPITDTELSTNKIVFLSEIHGKKRILSITRMKWGAVAKYSLNDDKFQNIELSIYEWLDLVRVLHKRIDKWEKEYGHCVFDAKCGN